jgi:hypothetical protein
VSNARFIGSLKSYSTAQSYGFLASAAIQQKYTRDAYFDKLQLPLGGHIIGMAAEFAISENGKGQPQAREIVWDPVPVLPSTDVGTVVGTVSKIYSPKTFEKLQKLLKMIAEGATETALVTSIDLQGVAGEKVTPQPVEQAADRDVDYVSFVLVRLGEPALVVGEIKNFVKMLLLLMLAKMLRKPFPPERCRSFIQWFGVLAHAIEPQRDNVQDHYTGVLDQIKNHVQAAFRENPSARLSGEESTWAELTDAVGSLQAKADLIGDAGAAAAMAPRQVA